MKYHVIIAVRWFIKLKGICTLGQTLFIKCMECNVKYNILYYSYIL